jgi:hypothetical protein
MSCSHRKLLRHLWNLTMMGVVCAQWAGTFEELLLDAPRTDTTLHLPLALADGAN